MTHSVAPSSGSAPRPRITSNAIDIGQGAFEPSETVVMAGTTVTWLNRDRAAHVVMSASGGFASSGVLEERQEYSVTFDRPGEYPYFCAISPRMVGRIAVR